MHVLIVDDEQSILDIIEAYLNTKNYRVSRAETGQQALQIVENEEIDFIILDIMLPDLSGWEVCQQVRETSAVPIILLTAKSTEQDVLKGLNMGADDYIKKPFSPKELIARMEAVYRRSGFSRENETRWSFNQNRLIIYPERLEVEASDRAINLTHTEFQLLKLMAEHPQQAFSREHLLESVKGLEASAMDRVIDSHIKNLRAKIEADPKEPTFILTVHGVGYRFGGKKDEDHTI
ncbi:response regulator transcription factor [Alkalibacterium sp. 20]|uniref:response regulator transcription factor n=1 Tax=Alkalibacterium sp. 20 TaxID=1798803 RepID=UPI000900049B|nr:response regulator transcription factor [Alkalibacterium sp. 20]OJF90173.1 two-component system response regulator [Alkalibacterium sp. 20]